MGKLLWRFPVGARIASDPIKTLGEYKISVKLHPEVTASFPITVEKDDTELIEEAANRQMLYLRAIASGPERKHAEQLLNEVSAALSLVLLGPGDHLSGTWLPWLQAG